MAFAACDVTNAQRCAAQWIPINVGTCSLNLTTTPDFQPVMTDAPSVLIPYSLLMSISFDLNSSNNTSVIFSAFTVDVVICTLDKKQVCLTLLCRYSM